MAPLSQFSFSIAFAELFLEIAQPSPLFKYYIIYLLIVLFQVCEMYLTFCGIGITNAKLFELSAIEFNRNRVSSYILKHHFNGLDT